MFKHGWGDCPSGCINNHFFYFEVDTAAGTIKKHGELKPGIAQFGKINLWGVPARFAVAPFKDFDAVLKAANHEDWWVALHAVEVIGMMLAGRKTPMYGEDRDAHLARFNRVRDGVQQRQGVTHGVLVRGLEHKDPDVRKRALWHLRRISKLKHGGDKAGIGAWEAWLEAKRFAK